MKHTSKTLALLLILALFTTSIAIVKSASAQTTQTPSTPNFAVQFVDNSYDIPTTHSVDPYTGQEITNQGYHVENKTIQIKIQNQPFKPFNNPNGQAINLYYNVRIKGHFEQNWTEIYRPVYGFPRQSTDSEYTVLSYTWAEQGETQVGTRMITLRAGAQTEFQVEAMIGYIADSGPFSDRSPGEYFEGQTSGWSDTQTITIDEASGSTSPSPTVPEFPVAAILPLFLVIPLIATILLRRKIPSKNV